MRIVSAIRQRAFIKRRLPNHGMNSMASVEESPSGTKIRTVPEGLSSILATGFILWIAPG